MNLFVMPVSHVPWGNWLTCHVVWTYIKICIHIVYPNWSNHEQFIYLIGSNQMWIKSYLNIIKKRSTPIAYSIWQLSECDSWIDWSLWIAHTTPHQQKPQHIRDSMKAKKLLHNLTLWNARALNFCLLACLLACNDKTITKSGIVEYCSNSSNITLCLHFKADTCSF